MITSREPSSVNFTEVTEAGLLKVMRALWIKALRLLAVIFPGLEALLVTMAGRRFSAAKHILTISTAIG
jgi:hypothetical protein